MYKLSWQASARNQINYLHQFNNRVNLHRANTLGQVTQFYESRAMLVQDLESPIDQLKWTSSVRSNLLFDLAASRYYPVIVRSHSLKCSPGTSRNSTPSPTRSPPPRARIPADPSIPATTSTGTSPSRYGVTISKWAISTTISGPGVTHSTSHYPAGLRAVFRDGVPDSVNMYNTPNIVDNRLLDQSVDIQDKWQAGRRLTLNMGVRIQKSVGWVPAGCQDETIFIAARVL